MREGITRILAEGAIEVVAGVGDAAALLEAVEKHQPELAIIDVRMPPSYIDEGLRAAIEIRWPVAAGRTRSSGSPHERRKCSRSWPSCAT